MRWRTAWPIIAVALAFTALYSPTTADAEESSGRIWTPQQVAAHIVRKAEATRFADLEAFGRAAERQPAPERLDRIQYVAWLLLNQSEFRRFDGWNARLRGEAQRAGLARYVQIADLYALRSRYDQGDAQAIAPIERMSEQSPDWYVRVEAGSVYAYVLTQEHRAAAALKVLYPLRALVPFADRLRNAAESDIADAEGLALSSLQDLNGSAAAFGAAQIDYARPGYPRPDFDDLYNMASLAARLGRVQVAQGLYRDHHRLAERSDLPMLRVWDRNLCARVAEASGQPQAVIDCFQGLGRDLGLAAFLAPQILPARAIAYARLHRLADAKADLDAIHALQRSGKFSPAELQRAPQAEAEVLQAEGRSWAAFEALRAYDAQDAVRVAERNSAGMAQLTREMTEQLAARRMQLDTAQRNVVLQRTIIRAQSLLEIIGAALCIGGLGLLVWQWRIAGQLRRARRRAEEANRAKSEFLANMSHEIRTPLNGVVAVADMLAKGDLAPREREMAEIIRASGDTLQHLLSDILDLARIESGAIVIEQAPFQLAELVHSVGALSQLRCDEKGIGLEIVVRPDLPGWVLGDALRVRQVLTNFMSNAVKFTQNGKVTLSVERSAGEQIRFTVRDTGVGFDPASTQRILGRFQQADSSITRRFGGSGLGLAICCELAGLMRGRLDCDSRPGEGAAFWIDLPLPAAPAAAAGEQAAAAEVPETRLKILLADDHPTNRKVVELMLTNGVAELCAVEDGSAAVAAFRSQPFDLILMDMQMPVMDGLTAVAEIRRLEAERGVARTPVLMLTANALPEHVVAAEAAGADSHLAKPFTVDALFEAIEGLLARSATEALEAA